MTIDLTYILTYKAGVFLFENGILNWDPSLEVVLCQQVVFLDVLSHPVSSEAIISEFSIKCHIYFVSPRPAPNVLLRDNLR